MTKRLLTTILLLTCIAVSTLAQQGLRVADIFSRYGGERGCKMVEMHDTELRGYKLKTYQSLIYQKQGEEIARMLADDRRKATKIREVVSDGRIESGYYILPPLSESQQRYILYTQKPDKSGAVIYIEGALSPDDIMQLCYQKKK